VTLVELQPEKHNIVAKTYTIVFVIPYNIYKRNDRFGDKKPKKERPSVTG